MADFLATPAGIGLLILAQCLAMLGFVMISLLISGLRRPKNMGGCANAARTKCGWRFWPAAISCRCFEICGQRGGYSSGRRQDGILTRTADVVRAGGDRLGGDPV